MFFLTFFDFIFLYCNILLILYLKLGSLTVFIFFISLLFIVIIIFLFITSNKKIKDLENRLDGISDIDNEKKDLLKNVENKKRNENKFF